MFTKEKKLLNAMQALDSVVIAFSGGVDSALVAKAAENSSAPVLVRAKRCLLDAVYFKTVFQNVTKLHP